MKSKLIFNFGTMEAGKSALLLMEAHSFDIRNLNIICMKPSIDTRDGYGTIKSRMGIQRECKFISPYENIYEYVKEYIQYNKLYCIFVDESQFLSEDQIDQLRNIVDDFNITVNCYGLRTDFKTKLFNGTKRLFEVADQIKEMKIICDCGNNAIFNIRVDDAGNIITDGQQILIGKDNYKPICSCCYHKLLNHNHHE